MLAPAQRLRRWSLFLWIWRLHRWLALSLGLVIVVLSVTGGLLVLHHDLERWVHPERHVLAAPPPPDAPRAPLVPVLQRLQAEAPAGFRPLRLEPGHGPAATDKIVFVHEDRITRWSAFIDPWSGEVLWRGPDQSLLIPWLLHLHMHLHLGTVGYLLTGLAAVALTLLGLTGLWITRDHLRTLLRRPLRLGRGPRVAASDLHKWVGLTTLYFTLVLGGTGLWFAILIVPDQLSRTVEPAPLAAPFDLAQLTPIEPAIAATRAIFPGAELARIIFPWDAGVRVHVRVLHRDAPIWEKLSRVEFDPVTGEIARIVRGSEASTSAKWQSILSPLHFGYYGSPVVKWLYVVGGFAPAVLAASGTLIWLLRRRAALRAKRASPPAHSPAAAAARQPASATPPP